jgi:hypothetical protein
MSPEYREVALALKWQLPMAPHITSKMVFENIRQLLLEREIEIKSEKITTDKQNNIIAAHMASTVALAAAASHHDHHHPSCNMVIHHDQILDHAVHIPSVVRSDIPLPTVGWCYILMVMYHKRYVKVEVRNEDV